MNNGIARCWRLGIGLFVVGFLNFPLTVVEAVEKKSVQIVKPVPAAPKLSAKSYILVDYDSGRVLVEHNIDDQYEPASLTKMMTAYIVEDELRKGSISPQDPVTISEKAWRMGGSKMFIREGTQVSVEDLLRGVIIQSGNDASVALAEHIAGAEDTFASLMNQYADALGMSKTEFHNSTGMPSSGHLTTARDLSTLAKHIIQDFPEQYQTYSEKEFTYNKITQKNRNTLLWSDSSVDGLKTGYTEAAGYCLTASAERDGMRLISVVMGARSAKARAAETKRLLAYGFRFFETRKVYSQGKTLDEVRVWAGAREMAPIGVLDDVVITVPRGQFEQLTSSIEVESNIDAPVAAGQILGKLNVTLNGEVVASQPLVALMQVSEGGIFTQIKDWVLKMIS